MDFAPGSRLVLRQAQGDLEQGRKVGVYDITALIGAGGPAFAREASFGAFAVAQARICW